MGRDGNSPAAKIVLPLLAFVLLVTGACSASVGEDKGQGRATTTAAGERNSEPSPSAGKGMSLPDRRPDITGTITETTRGDPAAKPVIRILVEEDPNVEFSAGPNAEGREKLYFEVTEETRIFIRRGGGRGEVMPATASDLAKGRTVDAWHTGHMVMESYPSQTVASEAVIFSPSRARPEVFFPKQLSGPVDVMTSLTRGDLTLDGKGCLHVEEPKYNTDSVPVWPAGFGVNTSGDEVRVLDEDGRILGEVGQRIKLGGGEISEKALDGNDLMEKPLLGELLERCPGDYWLVSSHEF